MVEIRRLLGRGKWVVARKSGTRFLMEAGSELALDLGRRMRGLLLLDGCDDAEGVNLTP